MDRRRAYTMREREVHLQPHQKFIHGFGRNPRVHSTYTSISSPPPLATGLAQLLTVRSPIAYPRLPESLSNVRLSSGLNQAVPGTYPPAHLTTSVDGRQSDVQSQQSKKLEMQQILRNPVQYAQNPVQQLEQPVHPMSQQTLPAFSMIQIHSQLLIESGLICHYILSYNCQNAVVRIGPSSTY